ncbi:MAG: NADH-quinone oxidoreductase subunit M, partial [Methylococcaceae bacterium]
MPILSLILWLPLLGALLVTCLPESKSPWIRRLAIADSGAVLALSLGLLHGFAGADSGMQFSESLPWNPQLGSTYALGVDGLSLPMLLLAALLSFVALLASAGVQQGSKGYYAWMLMLETGMAGVFLAQDWALFYLFWELTLIPLFFLIDRWGGARRQRASLTFVLYTMGGSVFLLISLLLLYRQGGGHASTMPAMAQAAANLSPEQQRWVFLCFLLGFGVKIPLFPLHGWLPLAHVEAPSPVSILLSGVLLKMGAYGLLRVCAILPAAALAAQPWLAGLAFFSIIYGGLLAWRQSD